MLVGAHVSAAGGLYKCFANAEAIGAQCIQIFGASPQQWAVRLPTPADVAHYTQEKKRTHVGPVFLHAAYLVNLATPYDELWMKSIDNLALHLTIGEAISAQGLIFHIGSSKGWEKEKGMSRVVKGMKEVLRRVKGKTQLVMENAAGGGDKIGRSMEELGEIMHALKSPRVKVCIDTQHAFAAGIMREYSKDEIREFVSVCDTAFGFEHVGALHVNDSKTMCGSKHDRHENIGKGMIGLSAFRNLAAHPKIKKLPWILEVPGFENKGPDKKNVDIVKKLFF